MTDFENLKNSINPNKQPDKQYFLGLLDGEAQREYEDGHIRNVMLMLKALYLR